MGTWGKGNFDSDDSAEFLDKVISELVENARKVFSQIPKYNSVIMLYGHNIITVLDLLITISTQYDTWIGIEVDEAKNWKERYLKVFDEQMPIHADEDFVEKRRKIIEDTFDKVIKSGEDWD